MSKKKEASSDPPPIAPPEWNERLLPQRYWDDKQGDWKTRSGGIANWWSNPAKRYGIEARVAACKPGSRCEIRRGGQESRKAGNLAKCAYCDAH